MVSVHQLRYLLADGQASHQALHAREHAYLALLMPALVIALTLCAASVALAVVLSDRRVPEWTRPSWRRLWASSSGLLLLAYTVQENLEAGLEPWDSAGFAISTGHGGWIVLPLAILFGLAITLLLNGAAVAIARVVARIRAAGRRRALPALHPPRRAPTLAPESFARFLVGRGPPVVCH